MTLSVFTDMIGSMASVMLAADFTIDSALTSNATNSSVDDELELNSTRDQVQVYDSRQV